MTLQRGAAIGQRVEPSGPQRGPMVARRGMVACNHPLAAQAGLRVLQTGGNAIDAALAIAGVLAVVEPHMNGLGGDVFLQVYLPAEQGGGEVMALNGSGAAPAAATPERFPGGIPERGLHSAALPGAVDGWLTALERWGTRPAAELLAPALEYAAEGFPVSRRLYGAIKLYADVLARFPASAAIFLPEGRPPRIGQILAQPDLARSIQLVASQGREAYYQGEIAEKMAAACANGAGLFSLADLRQHRSQIKAPIRTSYRGWTVYEQPPVSQGHILLEELNILEGYDLASLGRNSAQAVHLMIEAKKRAFADRHRYAGDPEFVSFPIAPLLDKDFAAQRRATIDPRRADPDPGPGNLPTPGGDTTYFCVVDGNGMGVSWIQSLFHAFGCGAVADGTGIVLNNRLTGFSLDPDSPNYLVPGKRTVHTLNTYIVTHGDGRLLMVGGTPGADVQVQTNLRVLTAILDFNLDVQSAIDTPHWTSLEGAQVTLESRFDPQVARTLLDYGHQVTTIGPWEGGCRAHAILVDPESGALLGGSDLRGEGCAIGW